MRYSSATPHFNMGSHNPWPYLVVSDAVPRFCLVFGSRQIIDWKFVGLTLQQVEAFRALHRLLLEAASTSLSADFFASRIPLCIACIKGCSVFWAAAPPEHHLLRLLNLVPFGSLSALGCSLCICCRLSLLREPKRLQRSHYDKSKAS